jgi:hypothetical protein
MRELLSISDQIEQFTKELGVSSYAGFLDESVHKIKKMAATKELPAHVFIHSAAISKALEAKKILSEIAKDADFSLSFIHEGDSQLKVFEQIFPAILFIIADDHIDHQPELLSSIRNNQDYRYVIVINASGNTEIQKKISRFLSYKVKSTFYNLSDLEGKSFFDILAPLIEKNQLEKVKKYTLLQSAKPVVDFMKEIADAELRANNTRKLLNSQNAQITRKDEQSMNINDTIQQIRQSIQKVSQELDKNFKFKYDELNKPNTGKFTIKSQERIELLEDFDRTVLAEKSEKVQTTIPEEFQKELLRIIHKSLEQELEKDEEFIKSSFEDQIKKINIQLQSKDIAPIKPEEIYIPFPDKKRSITSFSYYNKQYVGEIIKKGAMEYFVALRDYTGLIMVVGGLLAPLSIVASASESGIFKYIALWVKASTAGVSLLMILYGVYDLRRRIPLKRKEEFERELAKAKETLQMESKRMFNETTRDWLTHISTWMRDVSQNLLLQLDKNVKDMQSQKMNVMSQEKVQQQKLQTSIDQMLRGIQMADKMRDSLQNNIRTQLTDLEKELNF